MEKNLSKRIQRINKSYGN